MKHFLIANALVLVIFATADFERPKRRIHYKSKSNEIGDIAQDVVVFTDQDGVVNFASGGDIVSTIQNVFASLSNRMDSLQERLLKVEEMTKEIVSRLNHVDCYDIKVEDPYSRSGIYTIHLDYNGKRPVSVYCDMATTGGGWTIIQQRLPRDSNDSAFIETNFNRNYHDYQLGFGSPERDYWVGLENIFHWTNSRHYELRVELRDFKDRKAHALYSIFYIEDAKGGYRLHVSGYSGAAGDSLSSDLVYDNFTSDGMLFSTPDQDHDTSHEINCSKFWDIGGWWYNRCSWANLNGPYKIQKGGEDCIGINWHKWRNKQCLKGVRMMIRPRRT